MSVTLLPAEADNVARHLFAIAFERGRFQGADAVWQTWFELMSECGLAPSVMEASRVATDAELHRADELAGYVDALDADLNATREQIERTQAELRLAIEELRDARASLPDDAVAAGPNAPDGGGSGVSLVALDGGSVKPARIPCAQCDEDFGTKQALGAHSRKHRNAATAPAPRQNEKSDETFEERRARLAREQAERTWAARHAEARA